MRLQNLTEKDSSGEEDSKNGGKRLLEESYSEIARGYEIAWDELGTADSEFGQENMDCLGDREVVYCLPVDIQVLTTVRRRTVLFGLR